ncbi:hypothetical protein F3Y22_tig00004072pilonHSYRG00321 [Hibiscus syriacus]|uniref:Uncharacterized protein n=1 Tax=Hibiscus syriacus TaxID=106335 RepID=A0A6A3CJ93_HIBSY|nr:hypothetical protein F3Y22_tig00004072pilonHSYRG00321 [Hibiscus syriacus]
MVTHTCGYSWHAKGRGFTYVLRDIWTVYLCSSGHMDCLPMFFGTNGLFTYVLRDIWTDYLGLESKKKSKEEQDRSVLLTECQIRREATSKPPLPLDPPVSHVNLEETAKKEKQRIEQRLIDKPPSLFRRGSSW